MIAPDWWAQVFAPVFILINKNGIIPTLWKTSLVVPTYKRGDKTEANNYRLISLLAMTGKLYESYLQGKKN